MILLLAQVAQGQPQHPSLLGWYLGFAIAAIVITAVVAEVAGLLSVARRIGMQAQMAIQGLQRAYDNTYPLRDLSLTEDIAASVTQNLYRTRQALEG
ncbi:MAG: hypothetical protein ACRD0C_01245 [Acidimicrobiia bacterium]